MYYIDRNYLGTQDYVIVKDDITLSATKPSGLLIEDGTTLPGTLQSFLNMAGHDRPLAPKKIIDSCNTCKIPVDSLGLSYLMRPEEFSLILAEFNRDVIRLTKDISKYAPVYVRNVKTLNSCSPIKFSEPVSGITVDDVGYASKIVYDTSTTKTGRMSVIEGPNVLTMQKDVKSKIISRFSAGKIIEIDFSALEPRVALAVAGSEFAGVDDVYSELGSLIDIKHRDTAKQLIISFLYGAGTSTMCRLTGLSEAELLPRLRKLKSIFKQDFIVDAIKFELEKNGYFCNHAGRPIFPTSDRFGVLFNNFCQSTAVDVSLSGFSSLLTEIKKIGLSAQPVCFIHDAVLIDVPVEEIDILGKMSEKLPTYLGIDFPTKLTVVDNY